MPCRSYEEPKYRHPEPSYTKSQLDHITQLLCYACGVIKGNRDLFEEEIDMRLVDWDGEHSRLDSDRVETEMVNDVFKYSSAGTMAAAYVKKAKSVHPISDWHKKWFRKLADKVFEDHSEEIAEERRIAQNRAKGLAKLTDEEREALGLIDHD